MYTIKSNCERLDPTDADFDKSEKIFIYKNLSIILKPLQIIYENDISYLIINSGSHELNHKVLYVDVDDYNKEYTYEILEETAKHYINTMIIDPIKRESLHINWNKFQNKYEASYILNDMEFIYKIVVKDKYKCNNNDNININNFEWYNCLENNLEFIIE